MKTRLFYFMYQPKMYLKSIMEQMIPGHVTFLSRKMCRVVACVVAKLSMKRFLSGSEKRKRKREDEKFREKLPKVTQYFQSRIRPWKWKKFLIMFQVHLIMFQVLLSQV